MLGWLSDVFFRLALVECTISIYHSSWTNPDSMPLRQYHPSYFVCLWCSTSPASNWKLSNSRREYFYYNSSASRSIIRNGTWITPCLVGERKMVNQACDTSICNRHRDPPPRIQWNHFSQVLNKAKLNEICHK